MSNERKQRGGVPSIKRASVPMARQNAGEGSSLFALILKNSIYGLLFMLGSGLILLIICTAIAYTNPNPDATVFPFALLSLLPSMFIGGFVCAKKCGEAPLVCGIVCGGLITLVTILIGLFINSAQKSDYSLGLSLLLHGIAVIFTILGAFAGSIKKKYKPKSRKYR